ncbi:MAG: ABC transporter substrate binding protein [Elusimicrobiales bacterium]|nr:ABC transporter substrate binding protein [Elusimicrobiales bacterium]
MKTLTLHLLLTLAAVQAQGAPPHTVAVLSRAQGVYMEAFSAFQAAYGAEIPHYDLSRSRPSLPPGVRTVVAFGGKAAAWRYPAHVNVVYAMAPGLIIPPRGSARAVAVKVSLIPAMPRVLSRIKEIQPGLKRLTIFWTAPRYDALAQRAKADGAALGMTVTLRRVEGSEKLPGLLRGEMGEMDAFWLPPDPLLVTQDNLRTLREFSWGNGIPFYGATRGITREGAVASIGVTFRGVGETAAGLVRRLEAGETLPAVVHPGAEELTLNATAARHCGISIPGRLAGGAALLFP